MLARLLPLVPEYISDPVLNWFTGCYSFPNQRTFKKWSPQSRQEAKNAFWKIGPCFKKNNVYFL